MVKIASVAGSAIELLHHRESGDFVVVETINIARPAPGHRIDADAVQALVDAGVHVHTRLDRSAVEPHSRVATYPRNPRRASPIR